MRVLERRAAVAATPTNDEGIVRRSRRAVAIRFGTVASAVVGLIAGGASMASAATTVDPDPTTDVTGGAGDTFFSTITSYLTGHLIISVLTLLAVTVGLSMLISWGRKAAKSK